VQNHKNLKVWQKAHALAVKIKRITDDWPKDSSGLISQIRRASLSIASNIAEGCQRSTDRDFAKFLEVSISSTGEVEYQLEYARDVGVITDQNAALLLDSVIEVRRMLYGLVKAVRVRIAEGESPLNRQPSRDSGRLKHPDSVSSHSKQSPDSTH
jgi:four helix bundle protein